MIDILHEIQELICTLKIQRREQEAKDLAQTLGGFYKTGKDLIREICVCLKRIGTPESLNLMRSIETEYDIKIE